MMRRTNLPNNLRGYDSPVDNVDPAKRAVKVSNVSRINSEPASRVVKLLAAFRPHPTLRLGALLAIPTLVFAQEGSRPSGSAAPSRQVRALCTSGLDAPTFSRVVRERFSALLGPASKGVPGSYAALDLKEADVSFAATSAIKPGAVFGVRASGGVADGVLAAISNQDVNATFGASVQVHLLREPGTGVEFTEVSCGAVEVARQKARDAHGLRALEISQGFGSILRRRELVAFDSSTAKIRRALGAARTVQDASAIDSLTVEGLKVDTLRARAVRRMHADSQPDLAWLARVSDDLLATELQKARELLKVTGFTLGWWSLEYGVQSTGFRLFTPTAARDAQLDKRVYPAHGGGVTYSRYSLSKASGSTTFWSVGTRVAWENNLGSLTKREVKDRKVYTGEPDERATEVTYTAYEGAYQENLTSLRVQGDYYRFLFRDNQVAWHVFPALVAREDSRTAYSTGLGLLFTARKESDAQTFVNAELFYRLNDLTDAVTNVPNSGEKQKKLVGRSDVGLRFSFPINFAPRP